MPVATCRDVVEALSDYLEESIGAGERRHLDEHLAACRDCAAYLAQLSVVVQAVGQLKDEDAQPLSPLDEARFLALIPQSRPTGPRSIRLGIDSQHVAAGDHLVYFWENDQDFEAAMGFLDVGLRGGAASSSATTAPTAACSISSGSARSTPTRWRRKGG